MDAGTVRGVFDLSTPATRKLRDLRTEGAKTDAQMRALGGTLDRIGGAEFDRRMETIQSAFKDAGQAARDMSGEVKGSMTAMRQTITDETTRSRGSIAELRQDIRALGRENAKPNIDVRGITAANAEVAALRANLAALSRERATPRVAMGGGFRGGGGGGGGGGGAGFSERGGGLLDFGRKGLSPGNALIGAGLAFARPLLGSATALIGSAGGAALGAGAVGLSGLAVGGVGALGTLALAKPVATGLKNAMQAQQLYNKAVQEYGRRSKEAQTAKRNLDFVFGQNPGTRQATRELRAFTSEWKQATAPGRGQVFNLITNATRAGRRALPNLAHDTNQIGGAVNRSGSRFANFLADRQTQQALSVLTGEFVRDLPFVEHTLENVALTFEHIAVAATPFFHDAVVWGDHWTGTWAHSTGDIYKTRREIGGLVTEFKDWRDLTGATFHLLGDIFNMGRPSGDSMVVSLTQTLDDWDRWIRANPQKVRQFFNDAERDTSSLAGALVQVVKALNTIAQIVEPLLSRFTQLARVMGGAGLLLPTAGRIALGQVFGPRGGGARGGGGGGLTFLGGGAAGARGALGPGGGVTTRLRTSGRGGFLAPHFGSTVPTGGAGALFGASTLLLGNGRRTVRITDPVRPGGIATPQAFNERFGGVAGARFAGPASQFGERVGLGARALGGIRGAGGAALRFAGPLLLLQGALGAATTQGNTTERIQGALSAASFGLIPQPITGAQARAQGVQQAVNRVGALPTARTSGGLGRQIARLQTLRARALSVQLTPTGLLGGHGTLGLFDAGRGGDSGPTETEFKRAQGRAEAYAKAIKNLRSELRDLHREEHDRRIFQQQSRARTVSSEIGGVFRTFNRKESVAGAFDSTTQQMLGSFHGLGRAGSRVLAQNMLQWARDMERQNPALKGKTDALASAIEKRFDQMGKHIRVVNGQIFDGSKTEWSNIGQKMSDPIELAQQKIQTAFTAIQNQALQSLVTMGFSRADARNLVQGAENSAQGKRNLRTAGTLASSSNPGVRQAGLNVPGAVALGNKHARGGMIPGRGLTDHVALPGGAGMAAPGEYWIANRHTMGDLSRATVAMYGKTAPQMITGETRRHAYATGSPNVRPTSQGARAGGVTAGLQSIISRLAAMGFHPGSTTGGTHAGDSFHYRGEAVDFGDASNDLRRLWSIVYPNRSKYAELFGPSYLRPKPTLMHFGQGFSDPGLQAQHNNHIHLAFTGGAGGARGLLGGGGGAMGMRRLRLRAPRSGIGGVPGALADRVAQVYASGLQTRINRGMGSVGDLSGFSGGGNSTANMRLGQRMMLASGWGAGQWPALRSLWTRESGWSSRAVNASSGAYGIPQALGHGHPYALGDAASQIAWGLRYIKGRYGSPAGAWAHEQQAGWYSRGGHAATKWGGWHRKGLDAVTNGPTVFGAGEGGKRERVRIGPASGSDGHRIHVDMRGMVVGSDVDVDKIGEKVAQKILDALDEADVKA